MSECLCKTLCVRWKYCCARCEWAFLTDKNENNHYPKYTSDKNESLHFTLACSFTRSVICTCCGSFSDIRFLFLAFALCLCRPSEYSTVNICLDIKIDILLACANKDNGERERNDSFSHLICVYALKLSFPSSFFSSLSFSLSLSRQRHRHHHYYYCYHHHYSVLFHLFRHIFGTCRHHLVSVCWFTFFGYVSFSVLPFHRNFTDVRSR